MINKRISKITMLTALFVAGVVNAQEFYTCVPKKSWWKDTIKESAPENKVDLSGIIQELKDLRNNIPSASDIANAVAGAIPAPTPTPQSGWKLIKRMQITNKISIPLTFGKYKLKLCNETSEFDALDDQYIKVEEKQPSVHLIFYWDVQLNDRQLHYVGKSKCYSGILELYKYG